MTSVNDALSAAFIDHCKRQRRRLQKVLLRCTGCDDQAPARALRRAVDHLGGTIALVEQSPECLNDMKLYHLNVALPVSEDVSETAVKVELSQRPDSQPLPAGSLVKMITPLSDRKGTVVMCAHRDDQIDTICPVAKRKNVRHLHYLGLVNFGRRTAAQIAELQQANIEFRFVVRGGVVGLATVPLAPLVYARQTTVPVQFRDLDGALTRYVFDVKLSVGAPLVGVQSLFVDEKIPVHDGDAAKLFAQDAQLRGEANSAPGEGCG